MARRAIPYGGVVACDADGCKETFTTYSLASLSRKQAAAVGWLRIKATLAKDARGNPVAGGFGNKLVDLCPNHKPVPITSRR